MKQSKQLTKQMLEDAGVTNVTEDGRIFKGCKEGKQTLFIRKTKYGFTTPYMYCPVKIKGKIIESCVHRIVYAWFYGEVPANMQVDHIDNNSLNNNLNNLQLLTQEENLKKKGYSRNQYTAKLSVEELKYKKELMQQKKKATAERQKKAAERKKRFTDLCYARQQMRDYRDEMQRKYQQCKAEHDIANWHLYLAEYRKAVYNLVEIRSEIAEVKNGF